MWGISYWLLPLFASVVWLAMLITMLVWWITNGKPRLPSMAASQTIAYISDVGAEDLKPLFITMSTVTAVVFDLGFIAERWLRHRGLLVKNTSPHQKTLSSLAIVFSIIGGAGLILLTIFDALHHHNLHDTFLSVFIGGYILSAIFTCAEYQRLGIHFREHRILRISFWIKLFFILVEIAFAIAFGVTQRLNHYNVSAVLEWVIALVFTFYVFSFCIDFIPVVQTKHHHSETSVEEIATAQAASQPQPITDDHYVDRYDNNMNGYANGFAGGHTAGGHYAQPQYTNGDVNGHANPPSGAPGMGQYF